MAIDFNNYSFIKKNTLSEIATAIRTMTGDTSSISPGNFATLISENHNAGLKKVISQNINISITKEDLAGITALKNCRINGLASIECPEGLTEIGTDAFFECTSLKSIHFNEKLQNINTCAFAGCSSLQSLENFKSTEIKTIGNFAFQDCSSLTEVVFPMSISSIGISAFQGCTALTKISLGSTKITKIDMSTFKNCISLKSISIPSNIQEISGYAFSGCTSLDSVIFSGDVSKIGQGAFANCESLLVLLFNTRTVIPTLEDVNAIPFGRICVPYSLYDEWINAPVWCDIADRITVDQSTIPKKEEEANV